MSENKVKKKENIIKYLRIGVQIFCFFILPSVFISIFQSMKNIFMAIKDQPSTYTNLLPDIILVLTVTFLTVLAGRFFCGWMCSFGSMSDFIYGIRKKFIKGNTNVPKALDNGLKVTKYLFLFGIIIFIWGLQVITVPSGVNPWDLFGILLSFGNWPSISELVQGWIVAGLLLLIIILGSFMVERFFCRYLCPLGAYFAIISRIRPIIIAKPKQECGACSLCTKKCSMGIDLNSVEKVNSGECINCMECINNCPRSNAHYEVADVNLNGAVVGVTSCALVAGAVYLGSFVTEVTTLSSGSITSALAAGTQSNNSDLALTDGTYEGSGTGFRGDTTVRVTVTDGIIADITMVSTDDDAQYINKASNQIFTDMLTTQSTDVDTVSGATYSSNGLIEAVSNALADAGLTSSETTTETESNTASAASNSATTKSDDTQSSTDSTPADKSATTDTTTDSQTTTDASNSESLATGTIASTQDGTYEGSGTGFRGDTKVSVTVEDGQITDISIVSYQDDQEFFERASSTVIEEIISNQDVDVDAVSGATYSSNGIMAAVADALNLDYTQPVVTGGKGRYGR